jgi:hypothetical protein
LLVPALRALGGRSLAAAIRDLRALSGLNAASAGGIIGFGVYGLFR